MSKKQMKARYKRANPVTKAYIQDWKLSIPFYANIEPVKNKRTPAFIWEITKEDEAILDRYEGYPRCYIKKNVLALFDDKLISVMVYIMTDAYKKSDRAAREGYVEGIIKGYLDVGFEKEDFNI